MKKTKTPLAKLPKFKSALFFMAVSLVVGCVTVNVNFPESAVQKASDDYVRDLYRTKEQSKSVTPKTSPSPTGNSALLNPSRFFEIIESSALADEPTFNMSSPKISTIKDKMRANIADVIEQKKAGVFGETNDGKIVIHDSSKLKPLLKKKIEDIEHEENNSRDSLYTEVVNSNQLPSTSLPAVRKSFARSFQAESPSGTWIQGADGTWTQKQ